MAKGYLRLIAMAGAAAAVAAAMACTVHQNEVPPLTGPSTYGKSVTMSAIPDRISQDGVSQSSVQVLMIGPDGRPLSGMPLRMDILAGGTLVDFGALSARTIVTGSDGTARVTYTAPPPSPGPNTPTQTVTVRAIPIGSDAQGSVSTTVDIRLTPTGVILPPADTPTPLFTVTPTPVNLNIPATFDASTSCPGPANAGVCQPSTSASISAYSWNFGDNTVAGSGRSVPHTYKATGTFNVTLTVTNDRGVAASTTQAITVGTSPAPSGDFTFSPTQPTVGDTVIFNADKVQPAPGRTIVQYSWNFGDGATGSNLIATHAFLVAQTYTVVLSVRDDADQKIVISKTVPVAPGNPTAQITFSPPAPVVNAPVIFDASGVTTVSGATIVSYQWTFGDGGSSSVGPTTTHSFTVANSYVVRLIVTDSQGRTATATVTVAVGTGNPVALFTFSPSAPHVLNTVSFDSSGTTTSGGATIATYSWNFGDLNCAPQPACNTSSSSSPQHQFTLVGGGTYSVRLTVTDSLGRSGSVTNPVTILP